MFTIKDAKIKEAANTLVTALMAENEAPDQAAMQSAFEQFGEVVGTAIREELLTQREDAAALSGRDHHVLTNEERKYYEGMIKAGMSDHPQQALTSLVPGGMPVTILEDVYRNIMDSHELLQAVNFVNVGYLTHWVLPANVADAAVWGPINSEITKEIEATFATIEVAQNKLSAYALIEKDMLELGPDFIDNYVRQFLAEAISCGLEKAIITGSGKDEPIGLDCVIGNDVAIGSSGYSKKTPVALASFTPEDYGAVLKNFAVTEAGAPRKFSEVTLVVSQEDYLEKVMPASTVMTANGNYTSNVFPFPTRVITSNFVPKRYGSDSEDKHYGILFVSGEYDVLIGAGRTGAIEFSDEFKFLEDKRTLKTKLFAAGKAKDATSAIVVDLSNMEPAYIYVKDMATA